MFTSSEVVYYIGMKFKKFQYIVDGILFGNIVIFHLFSNQGDVEQRKLQRSSITIQFVFNQQFLASIQLTMSIH